MSPRYPILAGAAAFLLGAPIVLAQTPQVLPPAQDKQAPPEQPRGPVPRAPGPNDKAGSDSLSEQLSRSGGVIRPPAEIDKPMEAPTPDPGARSMPVIPPPGAPGGNPDVKPK
jgi:hypothetical protein